MAREDDILVVVPTRNRPVGLERCLHALSRQWERSVHVCVVDDYSDDWLPVMWACENAKLRGLKLRLVRTPEQRGPLWCRENAIQMDRAARVVVEVDDDDEPSQDCLSQIIGAIERGADAVYCDHHVRLKGNDALHRVTKPDFQRGCFKHGNYSYGFRGYRRDAWKAVQPLENVYAEDYELFIKFDVGGYAVTRVRSSCGVVEVDPNGRSILHCPEVERASLELVRRYYGGDQGTA